MSLTESPDPQLPDVEQLAAVLRGRHVRSRLIPSRPVVLDRRSPARRARGGRPPADDVGPGGGRPGTATAIRLHLGDRTLEPCPPREARGDDRPDVRGVTISRKEVPVSEWVQALAVYLAALAADNASAREALGRLLGN